MFGGNHTTIKQVSIGPRAMGNTREPWEQSRQYKESIMDTKDCKVLFSLDDSTLGNKTLARELLSERTDMKSQLDKAGTNKKEIVTGRNKLRDSEDKKVTQDDDLQE